MWKINGCFNICFKFSHDNYVEISPALEALLIFLSFITSHKRKRCLSCVSALCEIANGAHFLKSTVSKQSKGTFFLSEFLNTDKVTFVKFNLWCHKHICIIYICTYIHINILYLCMYLCMCRLDPIVSNLTGQKSSWKQANKTSIRLFLSLTERVQVLFP